MAGHANHGHAGAIGRLVDLLGQGAVLTDPADLDLYAWDALSHSRIHPAHPIVPVHPLCVCTPADTAEVQGVVRLANEVRVPVVPYGGGSGLMGAAASLVPGIVVDLRRMKAVLDIDADSLTARVQAGAVLETVDAELRGSGLMLGHDPWTLPVATVGGTVSTDSLGYRGGKYGSMGSQVLGLEAVLPQGEVCRTPAVSKRSTGLDLKHLFIGGEGCFGILTEVTLRVFPVPETRSLHALRFDSFAAGFEAVRDLTRAGCRPILLDYGDETEDPEGTAILYLGFEGNAELTAAEEGVALDACRRRGARTLAAERAERFWRERHSAARRFAANRGERRKRGRGGVHQDWVHVALPASRVLAFRREAIALAAARGVRLRESGLWTGPELFSLRLAKEGGDRARAELGDAIGALLERVHSHGGSVEYCHGVGVKLAPFMVREHGPSLELMRSLKRRLDPNAIMNPGKLGL
ncbi:MAG: FAD-binding oxidoreductase [Deltaproteobacteria bacterium]|nr:FAD-binding oxidoreductase [Deltaproteobacteria bacterium]